MNYMYRFVGRRYRASTFLLANRWKASLNSQWWSEAGT